MRARAALLLGAAVTFACRAPAGPPAHDGEVARRAEALRRAARWFEAFDAARQDPGREVTFDVAVIERRLPGRPIKAAGAEGWTWPELDQIDPAAGGSSRAEVDALRLMAVFLSDWDTKSSNQRLLC